MEIKFNICDEVYFFNTASRSVEKVEISGIRVIPTGISKGEDGRNRLDSSEILYDTVNRGLVITQGEAFASEEECRKFYADFFAGK